jgi:hypothetical protein
MNAIVNFLLEHWPWVTITAILIVIAVYVCVKFTKWYYGRFVPIEKKANDADSKLGELTELSKTVSNLPCSKHDESFSKIMEAITEIRTFLMAKNPKTAAMFALKHSPLKLNEAGEKLLEDIGGMTFLEKNKDLLIACIDEKMPKTALDVEESALEVLYAHLDDDMFNGMKIWVYNSPSRKVKIDGEEKDYTVTINDVCFVLSLPLRDMYLEKHPDLQ